MSDPTTDAVTTTAGAGITPGTASGGSTSAASTTEGEKRFTQDEVNRLLAEERRKADEKRKADEARAKAQAAEAAAKESGEWKSLAETVTHERDRLSQEHTTLAERHGALAAQVEALIKAQLKELPDEIAALAPGGDDLAARLEWVAKARKAASKVTATATPGTPTGPRGAGANAVTLPNPDDLIAQKRARIGGL